MHDTRAAGVRRAAAGVLAPAPAVPGSALLALVALSETTEAAAASAAGRRRNKVVALLVVLVNLALLILRFQRIGGSFCPPYTVNRAQLTACDCYKLELRAFKLRAF